VNRNCELKICDFGLARGISETADPQYTEYVVTRHYRAPEVMTNAKKYDTPIGCIFAELLGRKALFPGGDYLEQLRLIISKVGSPSKEDLDLIPTPAARSYIEGLGAKEKIVWKEQFPHATTLALDLLDQMLHFNPKKRITVDDALRHEYFKGIHRESAITECKSLFRFDWEKSELDEARIQELMWEEIYHFRTALQEERERRLKDGSIPDFATLKLQQLSLKAKEKDGKDKARSRGSSKESSKEKSKDKAKDGGEISVPVPDPEPEPGVSKK